MVEDGRKVEDGRMEVYILYLVAQHSKNDQNYIYIYLKSTITINTPQYTIQTPLGSLRRMYNDHKTYFCNPIISAT